MRCCNAAQELNSNGGPSEDAGHSTLEEEEEELPPFLSDVEAVDVGRGFLRLAA